MSNLPSTRSIIPIATSVLIGLCIAGLGPSHCVSFAHASRLYFEEVSIQNRADDVILSGVLTCLEQPSRLPAVVLIPGDGPQTRDESLIVALSEALVSREIITLRMDKRGTGQSSGDLSKATTRDLADDVTVIVEFLKRHGRADPRNIGLVGHSEGALVASMVASEVSDLAFVVLMACPTVGLEKSLHQQRNIRLGAIGTSDSVIAFERQLWTHIFDALRMNRGEQELIRTAARLGEKRTNGIVQEYKELKLPEPEAAVLESLRDLRTPWFRYLLAYDPADALRRIQCPTLALFAGRDWQVTSTQNREATQQALEKGSSADFLVEVLPGLNHRFQDAKTGSPDEYESLGQAVSPAVLRRVENWISKHAK